MSLFDRLKKMIDDGKEGKNLTIPIRYRRLDRYVRIGKKKMYIIAGETGSGKSTLAQEMFILNPIEWYLENRARVDMKLSIVYFAMERPIEFYVGKWISRLVFKDHGLVIPVEKILGEVDGYKMDSREEHLVLQYKELLDKWEQDDLLICHEGSKNPSGMSIWLEKFAERHGTIHKKDKEDKSFENILKTRWYEPNHPNHIVLVITDHVGILAGERDLGTGNKKPKIDKFAEVMKDSRDIYGFSPVIVQQLNRNLSDVHRQRMGDLQPKLSDLADSSDTTHVADCVLAMFDPYRHIGSEVGKDPLGYDLKELRLDEETEVFTAGTKFYRSLHLLKGSYSSDGISIGLGIQPVVGMFKSMDKAKDITQNTYSAIRSGQWFLDEPKRPDKPYAGITR